MKINEYAVEDEDKRDKFHRYLREVSKRDDGFYILGDVQYLLCGEPLPPDWRQRDVNRRLTRYREDRPIKEARNLALVALLVALVALFSSLVSAVADFPRAWCIVAGGGDTCKR